MSARNGFTLVELCIVLLILSLLLGLGIPGYKHWVERAGEYESQRHLEDPLRYQMKTGKPCPVFDRQTAGIPPDLLALCPPTKP